MRHISVGKENFISDIIDLARRAIV